MRDESTGIEVKEIERKIDRFCVILSVKLF
jgi:hypothetical protein